ncbi:crossover junction endodeoxyribonuclease RuvC [soil metagenome]
METTTTITTAKIILGIDPGTNFLGYGVISVIGQKITLISLGTIDLSKLETHQDKLKRIYDRINYLVVEYKPHECSIEAPFQGKNVQSMLKLGRAQGVAMAAVLNHGLEVHEYAPRKVKQSVTGNGNASKEQVALMLQQLLKFAELPKYQDATDGLAVAVCHFFQNRHITTGSPSGKAKKATKGWGDFVKANPERVKKVI